MANNSLKKLDNNLLNPIVYIVVGILCCIFQADMLNIMFTVIGAIFIIKAVLSLVEKDWVNAAISAVIGVLIIVFAWLLVEVVLVVFGVLIVLKGIMELIPAIKSKNIMAIIASVVTLVVGVLFIVSNWAAAWLFIVIGVIFIINGVLSLLGFLKK